MSDEQEKEFIQRLQRLCEGVGVGKSFPPVSEEALLDHFEAFCKIKARKRNWIEYVDQVTWLGSTWFAERRLSRQISRVRELGQVLGWEAPATIDALIELDDLAFAATYGTCVPKAVKDVVRAIARKGLLAPFELRNLIRNSRLILSPQGKVVAKDSKFLMPMGTVLFVLFTIMLVVPLSQMLWEPAAFLPKFTGTAILSLLYLCCCSMIASFCMIPHRLTPRLKHALPSLTVVK
ncbi:MAG TPA: hypothetical protein PLW86_03840 [Rhodocyclaceae bacterium]|nr:hypothetical protein [Rhodocyclaceae bacterium]